MFTNHKGATNCKYKSQPGIRTLFAITGVKQPIHWATKYININIYIYIYIYIHRRRLLILAGGAETRNEKQLHTNFSKLSVIKAQFGSLINDVLYPIH